MQRRRFLLSVFGAAASFLASGAVRAARAIASFRYLRPPGALAENDFVKTCIGCGQCAMVCPNHCISFFGTGEGIGKLNTPYIVPRKKPCILCMKCGDHCPTGAIRKVKRDHQEIVSKVKMGHARVDENLCLSFQGSTCGVCYRACPLQDVALKAGMWERPIVTGACVGCGICESSCIQMPQAIKVIPVNVS